jgi:hypothetical protein
MQLPHLISPREGGKTALSLFFQIPGTSLTSRTSASNNFLYREKPIMRGGSNSLVAFAGRRKKYSDSSCEA